jgi:hypothetical protein
MALGFGFPEVDLFGVDMGTRNRDTHHSKETIYSVNEKWKKYLSTAGEPMQRPVPGNFGGTVFTNGLLLWSKFHMSAVFENFPSRTVFNCSDGAKIGATKPKLPQRLSLSNTPHHRAVALRRMATELSYHKAGEMLTREQIDKARSEFEAWYDGIIDQIHAAQTERRAFLDFYDSILPMLTGQPVRGAEQAAWVLNVGTTTMMLQVGYYFFRRVEKEKREELMNIYLAEFEETFLLMRAEAASLLKGFLENYDLTHAA